MRDYRDAKTMAKGLRRGLADLGTELTHSQSLELIAQAFGFDNWNILAAKIEAARPAPAAEKRPTDETLYCSFCKKSQHDVKLLIAGPDTFICNDCVAICDDVVADSELEHALRDAPPDADPAATLAGFTPEQLGTFLARVEERFAKTQEMIDGLDGDDSALPGWLLTLDKPERAKARARLAKEIGRWGRSKEIVARVLAARP